MDLDGRFFRRESGRMLAALTRVFGVHNLALARTSRRTRSAGGRGLEVPRRADHPAAWLMATAKNRAIDVLRRERTARPLRAGARAPAGQRVDAVQRVDEAFLAAVRDPGRRCA